MSAPLRFDGVWKRFRRGERVDTLRDLIPRLAGRLVGRSANGAPDAFWAVRDVSLEVRPGEVLGVVGPNGAGKSTLLKLATGILRPDRGRVTAVGRVAALIELAAGFHGDLTGRENVFLQGAVMGLGRREITDRFDDIVEFAGLEPFIDTPVKRYSSGMNARLGFSIAVHLDPDALLVDEVLSVGDREFQARAVERLEAMVRREIPVVIVSHELDRILALADRAILMSGGRVLEEGPAAEVVAAYVDGVDLGHGRDDPEDRPGVVLEGFREPLPDEVPATAAISMELVGRVEPGADATLTVGVLVRRLPQEETIFATDSARCGVALPRSGPFRIAFEIDAMLGAGTYRVQPFVWDASAERELVRGRSEVFRVLPDDRIWGGVHLNPRARRVDGGP